MEKVDTAKICFYGAGSDLFEMVEKSCKRRNSCEREVRKLKLIVRMEGFETVPSRPV